MTDQKQTSDNDNMYKLIKAIEGMEAGPDLFILCETIAFLLAIRVREISTLEVGIKLAQNNIEVSAKKQFELFENLKK